MSRLIDTILPAFNFYVGFLDDQAAVSPADIGGLLLGGFSECSGLSSELAFETIQEGGVNDRVYRLPSQFTYPNLELTKGVGYTDDLHNWHEAFMSGSGIRRTVFIMIANTMRIPIKIWAAERALPVKYSGPSLNAGSSALAIQKLEIAHEKLTLIFSSDDVAQAGADAARNALGSLGIGG